MTIGGITVSMAVVWLVLAVIFLIIEGVTVGLATIWFAAGSFVALFLSLVHCPVWAQVIVFFVVSICLLVSTRKIFVEKLKAGSEKTNIDALIGEKAKVIETIESYGTGQVKVNGQVWTAVHKDHEIPIEKDSLVKIIAIEGVKLVVVPV